MIGPKLSKLVWLPTPPILVLSWFWRWQTCVNKHILGNYHFWGYIIIITLGWPLYCTVYTIPHPPTKSWHWHWHCWPHIFSMPQHCFVAKQLNMTLFCCKTLKYGTFCRKTLKYGTFCRKTLKYGTFCRKTLKYAKYALWTEKWHKLRYELTPHFLLLCFRLTPFSWSLTLFFSVLRASKHHVPFFTSFFTSTYKIADS